MFERIIKLSLEDEIDIKIMTVGLVTVLVGYFLSYLPLEIVGVFVGLIGLAIFIYLAILGCTGRLYNVISDEKKKNDIDV